MKRWAVWCVTVLSVAGCGAEAQQAPSRVGIWDLASQRVSGETSVVVPGEGLSRSVTILVTVNTDGEVVDAHMDGDDRRRLDPTPAIAAVKAWRFRPQQFEGRPVEAIGRVQISYTVPEIAPEPVPFPPVDPNQVVMTLTRGACFGACPAYSVTISGAGLVRFSTTDDTIAGASEVHRRFNGSGVLWPGVHTARIDPVVARQLIERFRQVGFLGLKDEYSCPVTDQSATQLTFAAPGVKKTVTDYVGECVGMPHGVAELEEEIDRVAGTARWVSGTPETFTLLEKDGFDVRSPASANLAAAAALRLGFSRTPEPETEALLALLIDRGLPLDAAVTQPMLWGSDDRKAGPKIVLGNWLLSRALEGPSTRLFGKLVDRGVLEKADKTMLTALLHNGAACSPAIARALAKAGAEARRPPAGTSALTAIRESYGVCEGRSEDEVAEMAVALLDLGVPTEARDDLGWTALMGVDSPALAKVLLAHHADPNARDKDGTTPLLATDDDRVARLLLEAGADPRVHDDNGTVRQQALKQHMPATLAWLDAHNLR
ncbi:DUF6438 domain-containing protein [Sphingomonas cannabina]|uniref:DUF6438 domain-containing protein n=1 Tax=Sphingomonas cannabina TaxID=2899123 RepID=UPI001F2FB14D|nr:DUF6438 domain-containing protein [Sphingomonas cannabina]UIJ44629.1 DUF6438 domain-containing protein [Sphingomonas cannabina]